jgi:hypothetical protein
MEFNPAISEIVNCMVHTSISTSIFTTANPWEVRMIHYYASYTTISSRHHLR